MGFSSVTGEETIMSADNVSFDGTSRGGAITTDGQLLIGSTASPHIKVGTLTSTGSTVTITYSSPNINLEVAGGGSGISTIDGDSGSVTGSTIDLYANSGSASCGSSVSFTAASATEMDLVVTDTNFNTLVGQNTGSVTAVNGSANTGFGYAVLSGLNGSITQGNENTGFGYASCNACSTGNSNTGVGYYTLLSNATGIANVAVGAGSLGQATAGNYNTGIGANSLGSLGTGSNNLAIGYSSGNSYSGSESSNIIIGHNGVPLDSNVIRIGTQGSSTGEQDECFIAGIAGSTGTSSAVVVGLDTSVGQLLQTTITAGSNITVTPGAGTITIAATGGGSGITTIDGDSGSATGSTINLLATSNAGSSVSFSASGSTVNLNVTNATNTLIGLLTGNSSLSGINNTAIGSGCLSALTSGSRNSMMGFGTGGVLTTGTSNVGIGDSTFASAIGASNCTGVGAGTLSSVTSGNYNTAVGYGSSHTITTGTNNTSIGGQSSCSSTGTQNISIGYFAGNNYNSAESSNIAIGNIGVLNESNVIRIGTSGSGTGQQNACYIAGIDGVSITGSAVLCSSSGQLGDVVSALRFKEDIQDLSQTDDLLKLRPVSFKYKTEKEKNLHYGFVAEEVEKVFPSLVLYDKEKQPYSVAYHEMAPLLLMEIQKLRKEIDDLKKRVA